MDFFASLTQSQIAGIILQLVVLPFLFMALRRWGWAKQSVQWPKVKGEVAKSLDFPLSKIIDFLYTYEIKGITYQGTKPFFANSFKNFKKKKTSELMEKYTKGTEVVVFYNPSNHKISTLEPGRKDGIIGALIVLILLFLLGFMAYSNPYLITEIMDYFQNLSSNS
ncbi:DUF3592 domain-containing protein [Aureibaculum algae]|uniref:DUF3592 domain-containing protein n=1 Tax=Aureibaculum algae TaxID=2584122 RepID=A0A5B7U1E5_9FLAO|nr:DUF3592 domain-containing protein [Aureibaculum algae]QCX40792.1 DUF3592 domain-containing protein [Aureibaculum algae]